MKSRTTHLSLAVLLLLVLGLIALTHRGTASATVKSVPKVMAKDEGPSRITLTLGVLDAVIEKWEGMEKGERATIEDMTSQLVKGHLSKIPGGRWVNIAINERAFRVACVKHDKLLCLEKEFAPRYNITLGAVINELIARLPDEARALYLVRPGVIEITTEAAAREELRLPPLSDDKPVAPLLPLVYTEVRKQSLEKVLEELSDRTGYSIVVDARVPEKVTETKVTARLVNVPVDTAVRIVADMGGLSVVHKGNVLYVTTAENAAKLQKEK